MSRETPASSFERAADAVVAGDVVTLDGVLREHPGLVHARSSREHAATLLHYVAANGVENVRQKTPPNIVAIARLLLDAGSEVDAEADMYGGGATTLGLVLTSAHPRIAGVQEALADLLLARGARPDATSVRSCLANGCPEAAAYLANRGAGVDLEEAAGLGRLDLVERELGDAASLADPVRREAIGRALMMAVWYGHLDVTAGILRRGFDPSWKVGGPGEGRTALHVAAYEGRAPLVELLLRSGAPVDIADDRYGTTPLVWALHAWLVERRSDEASYRAIVRMLADAGSVVKAEWIDDDRVHADPELHRVLIATIRNGGATR